MLNLNNAIAITTEELIAKIENLGTDLKTRISVQYFNNVAKSRTVNKKKILQHRSFTVVGLNGKYPDMIAGRTKEEFIAEKMKGKTPVSKNIVRSDRTGKLLLYVFKYHKDYNETVYYKDGKIIDKKDAIEQDLFQPSYFKEKKTVGRGTVSKDKDFGILQPRFEIIEGLKIGGVIYKII